MSNVDKIITKPDVIFATLDNIEKVDKTHFKLTFYKYSRLDEVLDNLEVWKGKDIRIYISMLPKPPEYTEAPKRAKEIKDDYTKSLLTNTFWTIPEMLEE